MAIAEELERLKQLHAQGALSDEEYTRAKERVIGGGGTAAPAGGSPLDEVAKLRRSKSDRMLGGVCGGIAKLSGVETWIWRLILVGLVLCFGSGVLLYLLLWLFVPEEV
ncbi:PspC domain-containing protein [Inhella proteolytica]|uniref:PspC domain-containing protein n=1 Tax=Inhella proteolytica TaxID=2795029 RepID=A0A931J4C8_9BURK|nr:PspC domain-containing protein [Inhella proteolytica]MBH9575925.1 PspC domain-containing protein [Inhella proteolytica]